MTDTPSEGSRQVEPQKPLLTELEARAKQNAVLARERERAELQAFS